MRGTAAELLFAPAVQNLNLGSMRRAPGGWLAMADGKLYWLPDHQFKHVRIELDEEAPPPSQLACPECGKVCADARGLGIHRKKMHGTAGAQK